MRAVLPVCLSAKIWKDYLSVCWKRLQCNRQGHTDCIFICLQTSVCYLIPGTACICICMCVVCLVNLFLWGMKILRSGQRCRRTTDRGETQLWLLLCVCLSLLSTLLKSLPVPPSPSLPTHTCKILPLPPPLTPTPIASSVTFLSCVHLVLLYSWKWSWSCNALCFVLKKTDAYERSLTPFFLCFGPTDPYPLSSL